MDRQVADGVVGILEVMDHDLHCVDHIKDRLAMYADDEEPAPDAEQMELLRTALRSVSTLAQQALRQIARDR